MKKSKILLSIIIFISALFLFVSCIGGIDENSDTIDYIPQVTHTDESSSSDAGEKKLQRAVVSLKIAGDSGARTVLPKDIYDTLTLTGCWNNGPEQVLLSTRTVAEMKAVSEIQIYFGTWTFTMKSERIGDVIFKSVLNDVEVNATAATLNFVMKPYPAEGNTESEITTGALDVSLSFTFSGAGSVYAEAEIKKDGTQVSLDSYPNLASGSTVSIKKTFADGTGLEEGTYDVRIEFYGDESKKVPLNTWLSVARIIPGLVSRGTFTGYNLNEVYKINRHNIEETDELVVSTDVFPQSF